MLEALRRFEEISGEPLTWAMNPNSGQPEAIGPDGGLANVRRWPADVFERFDFQMLFTGGTAPEEVSPLRFVAVSRAREEGQLSYISCSVPLIWATKYSPEEFTSFVVELCNLVGPSHGYAGLAIVPHVTGFSPESVKPVFDLARRFQGVDIDLPDWHEPFLASSEGIKGVNWITVLGNRWIAALGGATAIQPRLSDAICVFEYRGGVVLQAGKSPALGDKLAGDSLAAYRSVGAALAPVRVKTGLMMRVDSGNGGFDQAEAERWQARFDTVKPR
ncbi:MAG: type VI immunity family protein [Polyangiaceae bacterium]